MKFNLSLFGILPSYGFFIRHAENIHLDNITMDVNEPDERKQPFLAGKRKAGSIRRIPAE
jgi:hypothetical protein